MPKVHLSVLVVEDDILYYLSHIKGDVLNECIVQQGVLGSHFTHICGGNEERCDEVMSNLWDVCQVLGLKVHCMPLIVRLLLTLSIGEHSYHFRVVGAFLESLIGIFIDRLQVIELIDRLRAKVYQNPLTLTFFVTWAARLALNSRTTIVAVGIGGWQSAFHPFFAIVFLKKSSEWWNHFSLMKDLLVEISVNLLEASKFTNLVRSYSSIGSSTLWLLFELNFCFLEDMMT